MVNGTLCKVLCHNLVLIHETHELGIEPIFETQKCSVTMRYLMILVAALFSLQNPSPSTLKPRGPQQQQSPVAQQPANGNNRGTQDAPIFVKRLPPEKAQVEATQEAKDRDEKAANDKNLVKFTLWLVMATLILAGVGILQLGVFGYQSLQLKRTVKAAADQSRDMKDSIAQAARTAKAMEDVAIHFDRSVTQAEESTNVFQERGKQQTRAYICVDVGSAAYQDRVNNIKFGGQTLMVNAGNTPAHNVRFRARAAILPLPLPEDFSFPLPAESIGGSILGPRQRLTITQLVDDFVPDEEIEDIKKINGKKALYIWGIISYEDVFSEEYITRFCQLLYWLVDGKTIMGNYIGRHNDAT